MMQEKKDVAIVGGGIVGSLLALILGLNGLRVVLIEKQTLHDLNTDLYDGRSYALNAASKGLLSKLNIWEEVKEKVQTVSKIILQQGLDVAHPQPFEVNFFDYEIDNSPIFYMLEDRFLRQTILRKIRECPKINHLTSKTVQGQKIVDGLIEITLNDRRRIIAEVAIGADGFPSKSSARAKIKNIGRNYKQSSIVGVVRHALPHNNEAFQFFLPGGPLAILPLVGNRSCYVWTMGTDEAKKINKLDESLFLERLGKAFNDRRGEIQLDTPSKVFPITLAIAEKLVKERFALIGDSAHNIHPIAGQGLNLGIRDVACLSEVLILARRCGEDIGATNVLKRYSRWRNYDILSMSLFTDITNKIFSDNGFLLQIARGFSFDIVRKSPRLKTYLMKEASGLNGDVPKLLQGKHI